MLAGMVQEGRRATLATLAFTARMFWWIRRLPFTWDSEVMTALTDLAVLLHLIAADTPDAKKHNTFAALVTSTYRINNRWQIRGVRATAQFFPGQL